jgi:streptogramin lyase
MRSSTRRLRPLALFAIVVTQAAFAGCRASSLPPAGAGYPSMQSQATAATPASRTPRSIRPDDVVVPVSTAFTAPYGVAADASGNVYVADDTQTSIVQITPSGAFRPVGSGFNTPRGVAVDAAGNVYVADFGNDRVWMVAPPFTGATHGTISRVGPQFASPDGVAVSASCSVNCPVYVADTSNNLVKQIVPPFTGATFGTVHAVGNGFNLPTGVAVDSAGNVYVADAALTTSTRVQVVTPPFVGPSHGTRSQIGYNFTSPWGVTVDGNGVVYVASVGVGSVSRVAPPFTGLSHGAVTYIGGFGSPRGIAAGPGGVTYVADKGSAIVRKIVPCNLCIRFFVKSGGPVASRPNSVRIRLAITGGSSTNYATYRLAPSNPSCLAATGGMACIDALTIPVGAYTAFLTTYNSSNGTGPALSANEALVVTSGTTVKVSLYGDPPATAIAHAIPGSYFGAFAKCVTASQRLVVDGVDAAGNYVLGAGTPAQSLTSSNTHLTIASVPAYAPNAFDVTPHVISGAFTDLLTANASGTAQKTYNVQFLGGTNLCGVFTEYQVGAAPLGITVGGDTAMWAILSSGKIARVSLSGAVTTYTSGLPPKSALGGRFANIADGHDFTLWYVEDWANSVGRMTLAGVSSVYPIPSSNSRPVGITSDFFNDGSMWFTESQSFGSKANLIGRINTTSHAITEFPVPTQGAAPAFITYQPTLSPGSLWFTEPGAAAIGVVTPTGSITEYPLPQPLTPSPTGITGGPASTMWFTEPGFTGGYSKIGSITTTGVVTEYPFSATYSPYEITYFIDGALWFNATDGNIHRLTTAGVFSQLSGPPAAAPGGLAAAPDGTLWYGTQTSIVRIQ